MPENKDLKRLVCKRTADTGERYEAGLLPPDRGHPTARAARLRLRSTVTQPQGFGALVQTITARHYRGRRVRFSALLRTDPHTEHAGSWLRIDGTHGMINMDNMGDRALRGAHGWTQAHITLDIGDEATRLNFGVLLAGHGAVDVADLHLDEVDTSVPTTRDVFPDKPRNLDFGGPAMPEQSLGMAANGAEDR